MKDSALKIKDVSKNFSGVKALTDINFDFKKGEIYGLIGSNGAGKSTLLNVIWGAFPPDQGEIFVNGEKVNKISPEKAQSLGISIIFQHRRLMPYMTVAENIFIDKMPRKSGMIDYKKMNDDAIKLLEMLDLDIDCKAQVADLSAEEKQLVEIVKACARKPKILLMDEPTTALRQHEVERLFEIMRNLKANGCSVVFISHRLKEVMEVCDKISIIRDGRNVIHGDKEDFTPDSIVDYMSGIKETETDQKQHKIEDEAFEASGRIKENDVLLRTEKLNVNRVKDIEFSLHKGEILGFAGLGGSGIDDIFESMFGLQQNESGNVLIDEKTVKLKTPRHAIKHGIGFVPEDRQLCGEFLDLSVQDNICIPKGQKSGLFTMVKAKYEKSSSKEYIKKLSIKTQSDQTLIGELSGGNQQKAIFAKWLHIKSRIIVMSEPTAGIDVAAKQEVIRFIKEIACEGKGILYTSSYITELMEVADRIIIVYRGQVFKEFKRGEYDHNKIYLAINGIEEETKPSIGEGAVNYE